MRPRSLMLHLLAWVMAALLLVWASFILVGWRTGVHEAEELTDGHLAGVAALLVGQRDVAFVEPVPRPAVDLPQDSELKGHDYQQSMSVVVWDDAGRVLTRTGEAPALPYDVADGFADVLLGEPPTAWRTFTRWDSPSHGRRIAVLVSVDERDMLASDIAAQMVEPGLALLPVIALVLGLAIRRGLRPLHQLSQDVGALDASRATALPTDQPPRTEFKAVVEAINMLLGRQRATLEREREVASEIAHELRTPLASLALNARALHGDLSDVERRQSLERLERDALHAGHVLSQMLALARASRTELAEAAAPLDLVSLAQGVVAEYAQAALDAGHELALEAPAAMRLEGHAVLLEVALRNLIENALVHTPAGTTVEVQIDANARWLQVVDNGLRHTPDKARARVPARASAHAGAVAGALGHEGGPPQDGVLVATAARAQPVRPSRLGLGLGHRVVEKIASLHGARFASQDAPPGFDTCYRIDFSGKA